MWRHLALLIAVAGAVQPAPKGSVVMTPAITTSTYRPEGISVPIHPTRVRRDYDDEDNDVITNATEGEFPAQLSVQCQGYHLCSAVVVNEGWALSAASCVWSAVLEELTLVSGMTDLSSGGSSHKVQRVVVHPRFWMTRQLTVDNIALLKVQESDKFDLSGHKLEAAKLPPPGVMPAESAPATVVGWNMLDDYEDELQKAAVNISSHWVCNLCYGSASCPYGHVICSVNTIGPGISRTELGSALLVDGVVVGIASWSILYGHALPVPYTAVSAYIDWILAVTETREE